MINPNRIHDRIEELANIGKTENGGVTRLALTEELLESQKLIKKWMIEAGMEVRQDPAGNVIGRKNGSANSKPVVIGSHVDTVSDGGKYDGAIGVICGIEVVQHLTENNIEIKRPIEVISFSEEEASRFGNAFFGSMALTGSFKKEELDKKDANGVSRREAMQKCGLDPELLFTEGIRGKDDQELYLELHIEQGPVLEEKDIPVGIVTGIPGIIMSKVSIIGQSNHIGGTPMNMRQDALLGASELIRTVEEICLEFGAPAVGAVGSLQIHPGETNIIPGKVDLSIDIRDLSMDRLNRMYEAIQVRSYSIAADRGLVITFNEKTTKPAPCDEKIINVMKKKSEVLHLGALEMASGGGHDAQVMARITDMGMVFVRSTGGSHNPGEYASIEDITKGTKLLFETALDYLMK